MAAPAIITDALGRSREAKTYPDGSYNCPFCMAGVEAGSPAHIALKCPNPACFARGGAGMPAYPLEEAQKHIEAQRAREREIEERKRLEEWRRQYAENSRAEENAGLERISAEAREKKACVRCAIESGRYGRTPKFVRHKKSCPHDKRAARHEAGRNPRVAGRKRASGSSTPAVSSSLRSRLDNILGKR